LRKKGFNKIQFQVDSDGKAFLELCGGAQDPDDPGNLCLPPTDPPRFKACKELRDFCKAKGINCDVGNYLDREGFGAMPTCWKMENFDNPELGKAGKAVICNACAGGKSMACWKCGISATHTIKVCAKCRFGANKGKCVKCKSAKGSGTANTCSTCDVKGCAFCGA